MIWCQHWLPDFCCIEALKISAHKTHTLTHIGTHTDVHRWTSPLRITPKHFLLFLQIRWIWGLDSCLFCSLCRQGISCLLLPEPLSSLSWYPGIGWLLSLLQYELSGYICLCYSGTPNSIPLSCLILHNELLLAAHRIMSLSDSYEDEWINFTHFNIFKKCSIHS